MWHDAGPFAALPPGSAAEVTLAGRPVAVCNVDGGVYAIDGVCPHAGGALGHGALDSHSLACPWHAWEFDCRTGESAGSGLRVAAYPVRIENGRILVRIP